MRASVRLECPGGDRVDLSPGDIIGRTWSAALPFDDERVSEAHALVSLRGGELKLLALRGALTIGRRAVSELTFLEGQRIALAPGLSLRVVSVRLPEEILGLAWPGRASSLSRCRAPAPCSALRRACSPVFHPKPRRCSGSTGRTGASASASGPRGRLGSTRRSR